MASHRLIAIAAVTGFVACSKTERPAPSSPAATAPAPAATAPATATTTRVPSFQREIAPWLAARCASAKSCHGEHPNMNVDLDLRADASYAQLVGKSAEERFGALRVKPGDPAASFIVAKLTGALHQREGKPMPIDPLTGALPASLPEDPDFVEHALEPWIAAGAPKN